MNAVYRRLSQSVCLKLVNFYLTYLAHLPSFPHASGFWERRWRVLGHISFNVYLDPSPFCRLTCISDTCGNTPGQVRQTELVEPATSASADGLGGSREFSTLANTSFVTFAFRISTIMIWTLMMITMMVVAVVAVVAAMVETETCLHHTRSLPVICWLKPTDLRNISPWNNPCAKSTPDHCWWDSEMLHISTSRRRTWPRQDPVACPKQWSQLQK